MAPSDPFNDPNNLLTPHVGSPRSARRVSFSEPDRAHRNRNDDPSLNSSTLTNSPTAHSTRNTINRVPPHPRASDSTLPLKSQLESCLVPSAYGTSDIEEFLPRSAVEALIDRESVKEYWEGLEDLQPLSKVLEYVLGIRDARLVFVIIVLMEEPSLLGDLMRDDVYDDELPLSDNGVKGGHSRFGRKFGTNGATVPVACFMNWSASQVSYFGYLQRQVKATILEKWPIQLRVIEVPKQSVLPFVECENKHDGNSKVFRVKVHHAHHGFKDSTKPTTDRESATFALKVLDATDELTFNLEVKALMKIRPNQHLVTAVTAFKYQERYHLLFDWADGGTLAHFWENNTPSRTHISICWLAQQCHGLADGLCGIHNAKISVQELADVDPLQDPAELEANTESDDQIHGRHGDIKPDNILWFSDEENRYDGGVLKITDFGVTAFHNAKTTKVPAKHVPRTITYAAPEMEVSHDDDEPLVSRPFDIWSLGCVYLEFITWILLGNDGVKEFENQRMAEKVTRKKFAEDSFYSIHRRGRLNPWSRDYGTVKRNVVSWMNTLRQNEHCTPFLSEFLDYIQRNMLVDKTKRESSGMVRTKLRHMLDKCQNDRQYAESQVFMQTDLQRTDEVQPTESKWKMVVRLLCG